jgi:hypothetical protein
MYRSLEALDSARYRKEVWTFMEDGEIKFLTPSREEKDTATRGRSCWTRRLVLKQRRRGCGRPEEEEEAAGREDWR